MKFEVGQRVKVREDADSEHAGWIGEIFEKAAAFDWYVRFEDGAEVPYDECDLQSITVTTIAGIAGLTIDDRPMIDDEYVASLWRKVEGKRVKLTLEVID